MEVIFNGDVLDIESTDLQGLLVELGFEPKRVVIALNETFVPKGQWSEQCISPQDRIEVLSAMQGG